MHENSSKLANSYINNINNILKFCNNRFSGKPDDITTSVSLETTTRLQNKYSEYWEKNCSSSRLEFFSKIKENFVEEQFLDEVENYDVKKTSLNLGQATIPCLVKQEDIADQYFPEKNVYATFVKTME